MRAGVQANKISSASCQQARVNQQRACRERHRMREEVPAAWHSGNNLLNLLLLLHLHLQQQHNLGHIQSHTEERRRRMGMDLNYSTGVRSKTEALVFNHLILRFHVNDKIRVNFGCQVVSVNSPSGWSLSTQVLWAAVVIATGSSSGFIHTFVPSQYQATE